MGKIKRLLVANRGEIAIRVFRAATELGIETVGIYSHEDRYALHRYKCDESYLIGEGKSPLLPYLSIDEIINLAIRKKIDAIHPGYGFLSENPEFAKKCDEHGIIFIGPKFDIIEIFGDKMRSKNLSKRLNIPIIPGSEQSLLSLDDARAFLKRNGLPILIKATKGGGGRGLRIVNTEDELSISYDMAKSESLTAFGSDDVIAEKVIKNPKHIEVQIIADKFGNYYHLFERDCSIQRRHQKMIEIAPSLNIPQMLLDKMYEYALRIARHIHLTNAATFEFLVDESKKNCYFLEVNPRLQVEHTVTEVITNLDIVQAQIRIAQNERLTDIFPPQNEIQKKGFAIQCRVTTEDPTNNFMPDSGRIEAYRSPAGFGIRLDGGTAFTGAIITPYYDSLLVKVTSFGSTFEKAAKKMYRALLEFRIRGIKSNLKFLQNVVSHKNFISGDFCVNFLETHKEIFEFSKTKDRASKIIRFLGNNIVNKPHGVMEKNIILPIIKKPVVKYSRLPIGSGDIFAKRGAKGLVDWIKSSKEILFTDTTLRDAHQSLLATRIRTKDMLGIADFIAHNANALFSLEMWGGATFDVSYRFLKEDPWERIYNLKERIPNILFQMLFRGSNAVGYANYPDNVVRAFAQEASNAGIEVFRIFDCFNWTEQMKVAMEEVKKLGRIAEPAISYTGDILDDKRDKYTLSYYVKLAKELELMGADVIAIKDMAGLLKPYASKKLFKALKDEISVPIHFHTHDTSGNGEASVMYAIEANVDIVDAAISSMSGLTSQPSLNSIVASIKNSDRASSFSLNTLETIANYWEKVRAYYYMFESGLKAPTTEVYEHEIPGGQYSNLKPQVKSIGLLDRWEDVKKTYALVNQALGDLIKVTPSSKVVGDLAIFLVRNNLTVEDFKRDADKLSLPQSVIDFFKGYLGQPYGGFDKELRSKVLRGDKPINKRPGLLLEDFDFNGASDFLHSKFPNRSFDKKDIVSYALYQNVFTDYISFFDEYSDVSKLFTKDFFFPLNVGEETIVDIEEGKTLFIKFISMGNVDDKGYRRLVFEINGETRFTNIKDTLLSKGIVENVKGDPNNPKHIISNIPGKISKILIKESETIKKNQSVAVVEAMKMETKIIASTDGSVKNILLKEGSDVEQGDLIIEIE